MTSHSRRVAPLAACMLISVSWPGGSSAQAGREVSSAVSCQACSISFKPVATIGDTAGPGLLLNRPAAVLRDGKQRFWVLAPSGPPLVYDHAGRFIATVGGRGAGPGEFEYPDGALLLPGDSVLVFDGRLSRATVIGPDLKPSRSIGMRSPLLPGVVRQWPSSVILRGMASSDGSARQPFHEGSFQAGDFELRRSFGSEVRTAAGGEPGAGVRFQTLAAARGGGLWSTPGIRYDVIKWTGEGALAQSFTRRPSWFAGDSRAWLGNHDTPPPPMVTALQEDGNGLLWVFIRIPAENWRLGWARAPAGARELPLSLIDIERLFDTMIEVIDPRAGAVLARQRLNGYLIGVTGELQVAIHSDGPEDQPVIRIVDLTLAGRGKK